jgi:hypothetical protein
MANTSVTMFFGDSDRKLQLTTPLIIELERKCGSGIGAIAQRLFAQQNSHSELVEIIRLGLIGGGCDPAEATALTDAYLTNAPIMPNYMIAHGIMNAVYFGSEEAAPVDPEQSKEQEAA